jgi:hypothetical protein
MPLAGILWLLSFEQAKESDSPKGEKQRCDELYSVLSTRRVCK